MNEEQLTWTRLEQLGLTLTYRQVPTSGWGYTWRGRSWEGPYETRMDAFAVAFSTAIDSLILTGVCPFRIGDCPLLRPPPLSYVEAERGKDEDEENPWRHRTDREG